MINVGCAAGAGMTVVLLAAAHAEPLVFPPLRHGVKAVFGREGNDHGGDLEGKGQRLVRAFHDLGVDLTRIEFKWAIVEPTRGTYDWSEPDRLIGFLRERGIEPMLMLYCAPTWAMRGRPEDIQLFTARSETNLHTVVWPRRDCLPDFVRFCEIAARRYAGRAGLWEFWNEPDGMAGPIVLHDRTGRAADIRYGGDAAEYTFWLKAMYQAVRRGNPDAQVAAGSLSVHDLKFIEAIYASGGGPFCDAVSLHPYASEGINLEWIKQVRGVMVRHGDWAKPIWLTEFGWQSGGQYDESAGGFPPSADGVARLIPTVFSAILDLPYVTHSFFFTLNDWSTGEGGIDPPGIHSFGLMDLADHRRPGFKAFRQVVAGTPREPRGVDAPVRAIAPPPGPIDLRPDASCTLLTSFFVPAVGRSNSAGGPGPILLRLEAPDLQPEPREVDVSSGVPVKVEPVKGQAGQAIRVPVNVRLRATRAAPPGTWPVTIALSQAPSVECLVTVPAVAGAWRQPPDIDGDLREWDGRLDIQQDKMGAGFGWDRRRLYFACRLTDSHHEQPYHDANLWKGDCVQLGVDPQRDAVRGSKYDDNDTELAMALTAGPADGRPILWRYACPPDRYVGEMPAEYLAVRRAGHETWYEAALPWQELGIEEPRDGQVIGVAVAGCDWEAGRRTVHRFGDGVIGGKEPYRFASLRLAADTE